MWTARGPAESIWGEGALLLGSTTRGYPNKLNLCCASHPRISEHCDLPIERPVAGVTKVQQSLDPHRVQKGDRQ